MFCRNLFNRNEVIMGTVIGIIIGIIIFLGILSIIIKIIKGVGYFIIGIIVGIFLIIKNILLFLYKQKILTLMFIAANILFDHIHIFSIIYVLLINYKLKKELTKEVRNIFDKVLNNRGFIEVDRIGYIKPSWDEYSSSIEAVWKKKIFNIKIGLDYLNILESKGEILKNSLEDNKVYYFKKDKYQLLKKYMIFQSNEIINNWNSKFDYYGIINKEILNKYVLAEKEDRISNLLSLKNAIKEICIRNYIENKIKKDNFVVVNERILINNFIIEKELMRILDKHLKNYGMIILKPTYIFFKTKIDSEKIISDLKDNVDKVYLKCFNSFMPKYINQKIKISGCIIENLGKDCSFLIDKEIITSFIEKLLDQDFITDYEIANYTGIDKNMVKENMIAKIYKKYNINFDFILVKDDCLNYYYLKLDKKNLYICKQCGNFSKFTWLDTEYGECCCKKCYNRLKQNEEKEQLEKKKSFRSSKKNFRGRNTV